jgi:hypothetical protein
LFESNESVIPQLGNSSPAGMLLGSRSQATLVIVNDDHCATWPFESTETVIVRLCAPTLGVRLGTPFDATLSIANGGSF